MNPPSETFTTQTLSSGPPFHQPLTSSLSDADVDLAVDLFDLSPSPQSGVFDFLHESVSTGQANTLSQFPAPNVQSGAAQRLGTTSTSKSSEYSAVSRSASADTIKPPAAATLQYREEAKVIKNREAQRRFKQKQKARSNEIAAQLAETTAKLHRLQEQKAQLEARNALLEKVSQMCVRPYNVSTPPQAEPAWRPAVPEGFKSHAPSLTLSVWGQPRIMSATELCGLSVTQMSAIWTDYIREMGACLIQLDSDKDSTTVAWLNTLVSEAMSLIAYRTKIVQPSMSPVMSEGVMTRTTEEPVTPPLDATYYQRVLALWDLSEEQMCDLMHLRRLSMTRRCVLSMERKALMIQLAISDSQVLNPTENILTVEELTHALQKNAGTDHQIFYKTAKAVHRGVLTLQQTAENIVHAYPHLGSVEVMLELLAAERGEASKEEIVEAAKTHPMTAEWTQLVQYHDLLGTRMYPDYLPISTCPLEGSLA